MRQLNLFLTSSNNFVAGFSDTNNVLQINPPSKRIQRRDSSLVKKYPIFGQRCHILLDICELLKYIAYFSPIEHLAIFIPR